MKASNSVENKTSFAGAPVEIVAPIRQERWRGCFYFFSAPQQEQDPPSQQTAPSAQPHCDSVQTQGSQQLTSSPQQPRAEDLTQQEQDPPSQQTAPSAQPHCDSVQTQGSQQLTSSPQQPRAEDLTQQEQDPPSQQTAPSAQPHCDSVQTQGSQQLTSSPQQPRPEASFPTVAYSELILLIVSVCLFLFVYFAE